MLLFSSILENMYVVFRVIPFLRNVARSILKAPKFYFYDTGQVIGDAGVRLENLVACALHKEIQFQLDCFGEEKQLYYLRNKEGREIDFCIAEDGNPVLMLEVKWSDRNVSSGFKTFDKYFPKIKMLQIVKELDRTRTYPSGVEVRCAHEWLTSFRL
ncbi:MAG: DUF4143 domain-containing protein [Proteobacteria bacterium]|nr:DUF4143 domain-containing protein [Pseudomonadota bacterium]